MEKRIFSEKFLYKELEDYILKKGFGSFNKNDFEVLIFKALLEGGLNSMSNYDISRKLKIAESKVKRLRYETDLKYNDKDEQHYTHYMYTLLNAHLQKISFKFDKNPENFKIQFVVENIALRKFLDNILKTAGSFSDSSFNNEVVSISPEDFRIILDSFPKISQDNCPGGREILKKMDSAIKRCWEESVKQENIDPTLVKFPGFRELWPSYLLSILKSLENTTEIGANLTWNLSPAKLILNTVSKATFNVKKILKISQ